MCGDIEHKDGLSFTEFSVQMLPTIAMGEFHKAYYRVLEAFACGRINRLIVTVPPQHGKSLGATTLLPAYMLGRDPDLRVAIASYSASLANRFNKRVQRMMDSGGYRSSFPETEIKRQGARSDYVRTADRVEIIGRMGELMSVGRSGSLTGNQVDVFILDDLYKDAMEANSSVIRENCWEWYTSVVRTRMHNSSRELIVFTRWHEEDLIGTLIKKEGVVTLERWEQLDTLQPGQWALLNFEAVKESPPTEIDGRAYGEPLWADRHGADLLAEKKRLDPLRFECMYQGKPSSESGLLYGDKFATYTTLPADIVRYGNYTDTADTGDDYLCSVCYAVSADGGLYVTDVVYSREKMEITENLVAEMLRENGRCDVLVESNNGGRGFARALSRLCPSVQVGWFHQGANKEARILSNSSAVIKNIVMPVDWKNRWGEFSHHLITYKRVFRSNRWHDAADVLTGVVEREVFAVLSRKIRALSFSR